jgi:flagellar motor switch protein FliN/FliY
MKSSVAVLELEQLADRAPSLESAESAQLVPRDIALFGHVSVRVRVEIGYVDLAIERLMACKPGDVLTLAQDLDTPVTLFVEDKPVARGTLVAVDDNFGVQITEIL